MDSNFNMKNVKTNYNEFNDEEENQRTEGFPKIEVVADNDLKTEANIKNPYGHSKISNNQDDESSIESSNSKKSSAINDNLDDNENELKVYRRNSGQKNTGGP